MKTKPETSRVFARLIDGAVVELISEVTTIEQEWHPSILARCVDVTGVKPNPKVGWVKTKDDPLMFTPAPSPVLSPADQMQRAMIAGREITGIGTFHGTGTQWLAMQEEALYIATFGAFSAGNEKLVWGAISGDVIFKSTDDFKAVARAVGDWRSLWSRFVDGKLREPPSQAVALAKKA